MVCDCEFTATEGILYALTDIESIVVIFNTKTVYAKLGRKKNVNF